jgi:predicted transcriptional regulator
MVKTSRFEELRQFGLTDEEATLYVFLLQVKSATMQDISKSPEFQTKRRPNLYKVIASLEQKGFVTEEEKGGRKRFFPEPSEQALESVITKLEKRVQELRTTSETLTKELSELFESPNPRFTPLPEILEQFVSVGVNPEWIIKETPETHELKLLGTIYSVEFNTGRKLGADAAGLVVNEFRYEEHRDAALQRARDYQKERMATAMQAVTDHGPVHIERFWFEEKFLRLKDLASPLPYLELRLKWNFPGSPRGGLATVRLQDFPTLLLSAWGANYSDFKDIMQRISRNFHILPEPVPESE